MLSMPPPHLPPHFSPGPLQVSYASKRHAAKRPRTDDGGGGGGEPGDASTSLGLAMLADSAHGEDAPSADLLMAAHHHSHAHHTHHSHHHVPHEYQSPPLHHSQHPQQQQQQQQQQHHHHRLPSQATLAGGPPGSGSAGGDADLGSPGGSAAPGSQSVVGQPGMPDPAPRPRGPKLKFTPEEDRLLVELKENKNLTWKQIADFFPGRTSGTLQVRYCTKLKAKATVWTDEAVSPKSKHPRKKE
ncbi:hypothetical protein LOZ07_006879 [Ophidiomyces ophidiicola]|nr:hypothetical protein LOZ47_006639 [Ophidiomyces ophidiicola]KAI2041479.1 hypothetical protein LOZ44_006543 [Ophidiomyces ophidiicola]KAI2047041.1 hypothetical protein LOZ38_005113 [Ophidiomyces ophidiicola]KAI2104421.1 hypothetical protein LOZ42_006853 [Ophidiomyces ophidiicola]KAI2109413.1 hypothetical protein LOZ32_006605 [Ophidiomyces ophidiicola]